MLADPGLLERALANLLDNAIRYSPPDAPPRVTAGSVDGVVDVRIADRGPGVPATSATASSSPSSDSAIHHLKAWGSDGRRQRLRRGHGGEIETEDTPGGGLTVVVRLRAAT